MQIEIIDIDSVIADPANCRVHDSSNLEAIKTSLARFGQQKPIVVDGDNIVVAGNGTLSAARELGWHEIKVVRTELAGSDRTAYSIADNRTAELAAWDRPSLAQMLGSLASEESLNAWATGFTQDDLDELATSLTKPNDEDWAASFEKSGDTSRVDNLKQVTFVLSVEDHNALMNHLDSFGKDKNKAIVLWLKASS